MIAANKKHRGAAHPLALQFGGALLLAVAASGQTTPAEYQAIKVRFRVVDLDGRPLERASVLARLDPNGKNKPSDHRIQARAGDAQYEYSDADTAYQIFSNEQQVNDQGLCSGPFIVYANRTEPIDYDLNLLYKEPNTNVILDSDRRHSFTIQDAGATVTLHANTRRALGLSSGLIALACWLGLSVMGCLLFYRAIYQRLLDGGRSVDMSRAFCHAGALFVSLLALGVVYWWMLPRILSVWFLVLLVVFWIVFFILALPKRQYRNSRTRA